VNLEALAANLAVDLTNAVAYKCISKCWKQICINTEGSATIAKAPGNAGNKSRSPNSTDVTEKYSYYSL